MRFENTWNWLLTFKSYENSPKKKKKIQWQHTLPSHTAEISRGHVVAGPLLDWVTHCPFGQSRQFDLFTQLCFWLKIKRGSQNSCASHRVPMACYPEDTPVQTMLKRPHSHLPATQSLPTLPAQDSPGLAFTTLWRFGNPPKGTRCDSVHGIALYDSHPDCFLYFDALVLNFSPWFCGNF